MFKRCEQPAMSKQADCIMRLHMLIILLLWKSSLHILPEAARCYTPSSLLILILKLVPRQRAPADPSGRIIRASSPPSVTSEDETTRTQRKTLRHCFLFTVFSLTESPQRHRAANTNTSLHNILHWLFKTLETLFSWIHSINDVY